MLNYYKNLRMPAAFMLLLVASLSFAGPKNLETISITASTTSYSGCPGDTLDVVGILVNTDCGAFYEVEWTSEPPGVGSDLFPSNSLSPKVVVRNGVTIYKIKVTENCTQTADSVEITVIPTVVAFTGEDFGICVDDSKLLGGSADPSISYSWSPASGLSSVNSSNPTVTFPGNFALPQLTYTLSADNGAGCVVEETINVSFFELPEPSFSADTVCSGSATTFVNETNNSATMSNYLWEFGQGVAFSMDENPAFTYAAGGEYTVKLTATSVDGCQEEFSKNVLVPSTPQILGVIKSDPTDCNSNNGRIIITAQIDHISPEGIEYSIDGGITWSVSRIFNGLSEGNYPVQVRNGESCTTIGNTVSLSEPPAPQIISASKVDPSDCSIQDGSISVSATGGTGSLQYSIDGINWGSTSNFQNLGSGSYPILVRNSNGTCRVSDGLLVLTEPAAPLITDIEREHTSNCLAGDGKITIATMGGALSHQYSINGGATWFPINEFENLTADTYQIRVRNADGTCVVTGGGADINDPAKPIENDVILRNPSDCASNDGRIEIDASPGVGFPHYSIDGGNTWVTNNLFINMPAGSYDIALRNTDETCLVFGSTVLLTEPQAIVANTPVSANPTDCDTNDGTISLSVSSGGAPVYSIDGGTTWSTIGDFTGLSPKTYELRVRNFDETCEQDLGSLVLSAPSAPVNVTFGAVDPTICNGTNGVIQFNGNGGSYQYSVNDGANWQADELFANLSKGEYQLKVRNADATCETIISSTELTAPPTILIQNVLAEDVSDCGVTDGSVSIVADYNGPADLEYSIDGGGSWSNNFIYTDLGEGDYQIIVRTTDATCLVTGPAEQISAPSQPIVDNYLSNQISDCRAADGTIFIIENNINPFEISIDNGLTYEDQTIFNNLDTGGYIIKVRNLDGSCESTVGAVIMNEPILPEILSVSEVHPTACDASDGSLTITSDPVSGVEYSIDGFNWTANRFFDNLTQGDYRTYIRLSGGGCHSSAPIVSLRSPGDATQISTVITDATCGNSDGIINISANGQLGTIEYSINDGASWAASGAFTGLSTKSYSPAVRVNGTCITRGEEVEISNSDAPIILDYIIQNPSHCLSADGSISITADQDHAGLQFSIDGGTSWQSGSVFNALTGGVYQLLVRTIDETCATSGDIVYLISNGTPVISEINAENGSCGAGGNLNLTAFTTSGKFEYSLNNGASWGDDSLLSDIAAGSYMLRVRDSVSQCEAFGGSYRFNASVAPEIDTVYVRNPECNINTGRIEIQLKGFLFGEKEYSFNGGFNWVKDNTLEDLFEGTYSVAARNLQNGVWCRTDLETVELTKEDIPTFSISISNPSDCGIDDGRITINAQGSDTLEFSANGIDWQRDNILAGLPAGGYMPKLRYSDGTCINNLPNVSLIAPRAPTFDRVEKSDTDCFGDGGSITVFAQAGSNLPIYSINDGLDWFLSNEFTDLSAGDYEVLIANDNESCQVSGGIITVSQQNMPALERVSGSPATCFDADGQLEIIATLGTESLSLLEYSVDSGRTWQTNPVFSGLASDVYRIQIRRTDDNQCGTDIQGYFLESTESPDILLVEKFDITDCDADNGSIQILATGRNDEPDNGIEYSLNGIDWSTNSIFQNLPEGDYFPQVRFLDGTCAVVDAQVNISGPRLPERVSINVTDPDCNAANGSIMVAAAGSDGDVQYSIDGVNWFNTGEFTNLAQSTYAVMFRYTDGKCVTTDTTIFLTPRNVPGILDVQLTPASACDDNNGSVVIRPMATGPGSPGIQYRLDNGVWQNSNVFDNLSVGTYNAAVRFADGTCEMPPDPFSISALEDVTILSVTPLNISNCNITDGQISLSADAVNEVEYSLDGLTWTDNATFTGLAAGVYSPMVRLKNFNCTKTADPVTIEDATPIFIENVVGEAVTDCDVTDGSITVQMLPGSGAVEYSIDNWATSSMTNFFQNLSAGSYDVSVRKSDGTCVTPYFNNPIVIEAPEAPAASLSFTEPECFRDNGSITVLATAQNNPNNLTIEYSMDGLIWTTNNRFENLSDGTYSINIRLENTACMNQVTQTLSRPANCDDCDGMIRIDLMEVDLAVEQNPLCIPMMGADLSNHVLTLNGQSVQSEGGCEADSIYYYGYAPLAILGGTSGPFELRSWTYNGTTYSGNFDSLDDIAAALSNWDDNYDWSSDADNLTITGGGIGNTYGDMVLYSIPLDRSFNLMTNSFAEFQSFNLTITEGGTYELIATDNDSNCSDTLTIVVTPAPPPCPDPIFTYTDTVLSATNDTAQFCIPIELLSIGNYNIVLDGINYTGATRPCMFDSVWTYLYFTFPDFGAAGPYNVNWNFDGSNFAGTVQDMNELVMMMNIWDPSGDWRVVSNIFSLIGNKRTGADAGNLVLTQVNTGLDGMATANPGISSGGTEIEIIGAGSHTLFIENIAEACSESITVTLINKPTNSNIQLTTPNGTAIPTQCLPTDELPGNLTDIFVCAPPMSGVLNTDNAPCFDYTPNVGFVGTDIFCLVICDDSSPVVCDTTFVEITVEPGTNCKVFNGDTADLEMTTCSSSGQVCLPVLPAALADYTLFVNGSEYTDARIACDIKTIWSYDLSVLPQGAFNVDSWTVNGMTFTGSFNDINQLTDSLNVWDVSGDWNLDNFIVSGGESSGVYSDLVLSSSLGLLTLNISSDPQPQGVEITLDFGTSRIIAVSPTGCEDTLDVNIICTVLNDISTDVSLEVGESTMLCLKDQNLSLDLSYINSVTNNCTNSEADFSFDEMTNCLVINGVQAGLDTACYEICLENGTCFNWNINAAVTEDCIDFLPQDSMVVGVTCDGPGDVYVCLRGFAEEIQAGTYSLEIDGTPYIGDLEPCGFDSTFSINYFSLPGAGDAGPYEIIDFEINGEKFLGEFPDIDALIDSMNLWDPTGNWMRSSLGTIIVGGNPRNNYGAMSVEQVATANPALLDFNTLIVPKGYGFTVPALGSYELTFISNVGSCTDTVTMTTACVTTENIELTIMEGDFDQICLPTDELPGDFTETFNLCSDESDESVVFDWIASDNCFTYEGFAPGTDRACFIICDQFGVCDTTYYTINVLDGTDTTTLVAVNDSVSISIGENTIINVSGNDIFGGALDSIYLLGQPKHGIATVLPDLSIQYIPEPGYCDDLVPDVFEYVACSGMQCDTAQIEVLISCDDLNFCNGFSPNGDGINDTFIIGGIEKFTSGNLKIYNRWGNLVLNRDNYANDWEGDFDGLPLPDGTYFYLFDTGEGENFSGYLQIHR